MENLNVAQQISQAVMVHKRPPRPELLDAWSELLAAVCDQYLPSGSGFDSGTELVMDDSTPDRLVFETAFHPINFVGYYEEWQHFIVTVTPTFRVGYNIDVQTTVWLDDGTAEKIDGNDDLMEHIAEQFAHSLAVVLPSRYTITEFLRGTVS